MSTVANRTSSLNAAKAAKNDEFYTQWADIEREVNAYLEYDPDVFRGKVLLLPCDDPEWSNFAKFFALHFVELGLKKLISTSYAPDSNPALFSYEPTLFEMDDPKFDETKTRANGKKFVLEPEDINGDGVVNIDDLQWDYLEGDGDFRSTEVTALRDEADIIITNPPFSLFREFLTWIQKGAKQFSIIGNENAIAYKNVFRLIKQNKIWKGATANSTDMVFGVPKGYPVKESDRLKAEKLGYPPDDEHHYTRLGNSCWFTNIEHGRRHEPLQLMTMADNLRYNKKLITTLDGGTTYQRYDNFDAIEVPYTDAIPSDYEGVMGVPITWLAKYNPDQFEIIGTDETDYEPTKLYKAKRKVVNGSPVKSNTGSGGGYIRVEAFGSGTYFDVGYPVRRMYKRIFIRHRKDA
ncbi:adenine-specific methyltransferase EcoRI family protein [Agromyces archimandritae]|uniref:Adenine-specific methyltransferase EcoRI family protein n=1 Tax=Agromyces archimandritae TaxID=2781962 RepID=A0A975FKH8_9MICO|nr:adenine-specific methyltransferase EcoRI family protein [Agromyces archimandritae]QTX04203.1 adenine-specific methyltransferase EcoRI family protein [Agromyces archimandritae]